MVVLPTIIIGIIKKRIMPALLYVCFSGVFRRHHTGNECQRPSPSALVRHDQESRPSSCQDPLLECQLHRLIESNSHHQERKTHFRLYLLLFFLLLYATTQTTFSSSPPTALAVEHTVVGFFFCHNAMCKK